jgi:hypothetical protein
MKFILLLLFLPLTANATTYVFQPGKPMQVITQTTEGYVVSDMGGGGNTVVQEIGGMTVVYGGTQPPAFIMDGGERARGYAPQPVIPLTPNTGGIDLAVPVEYTE